MSETFAERLPARAPGWWCWRCGWWKAQTPGRYRPNVCPDCGPWSQERRLPTDTVRPVLVTLEAGR
ncbi:MAG: hypothetical protein JWO67_4562 [Streptosporangiaceae bacterium]|nr:hypothetical protein [Streptosporangiaceae bacterium]